MSKIIFLYIAWLITSSNYAQNLTKNWEIADAFKSPESVVYAPESKCFYVSNMNGDILAKDGNGFISKVSEEGKIIEYSWIDGLNAPKGMFLHKGKLYVSDIDELLIIDTLKATVIDRIRVEGSKFLNDVAVSENGTVYISDSQTKKIYLCERGKTGVFVETESLTGLNGLWYSKGSLYAGTKSILQINIKSKKISKIIDVYNKGSIDGLQMIGKQEFICSNWQGNISLISNNNIVKLLDLSTDKNKSGDILFVKGKNWVLVPTLVGHSLISFSLIK